MDDATLFEIAAKLHNLRLADLRLRKRYLDAVIIETKAGVKYTHLVADLEIAAALGEEASAATGPAAQPSRSHTRRR